MHYLALVLLPKHTRAVAGTVARVLAPFREDDTAENGFWDWWQIGGRFTGLFSGYDPEKDPANAGADGRIRWPTEWVSHAGDVVRAGSVKADKTGEVPCYTFVGPETAAHRRVWDSDRRIKDPDFDRNVMECLSKHPDDLIVVVDYHN